MQLKILSLLTCGLLLSLFVTKPSREDFDRELTSVLREAISASSLDNDNDILSNLTIAGCKLRTNDCMEILRKASSISSRDYIFWTRHDVSGPGTSIACWGLLKQFVCDGSVSVPAITNAVKSFW
jgi:hypothetical protein